MHDVVHDAAQTLASRDRPIFVMKQFSELKEWPKLNKECYRMFVPECYISDLPKSLECPELEILEIGSENNFLKVPDHFFAETKELKHLYLKGMYCIPSLTPSFSQLPKLCALHLEKCMLEDIAILAELKNLEILDLRGSNIRELPPAIGNLTRLRFLDLSLVTGLRSIPAKIISSLTRLEELYMWYTFIEWEDEETKGNNACLGELRHLYQLTILEVMIQDASVFPKDFFIFGQLNKYNIFVGDNFDFSYPDATFSKTLRLNQGKAKSIHLDKGIKLLLSNVEDLSLSDLHGVSSVLYQLNETGFPQLKLLDVQSSDNIQYIIDPKGWHNSLESLILHNLPSLMKICNGALPVQSFTKLKVIKVKSCDHLENVFSYSLVKELSSLSEIEISHCKIMSKIIDEDTEIDKIELLRLHSITLDYLPNLASFYSKPMATNKELRSVTKYEDNLTILRPLFDEKISFPNLDRLKISSINLKTIWNDKLSQCSHLQNLKTLIICDCIHLRFLFPSLVARRLVNLQHLSISRCGTLEEIFSTEETINFPSATIPLSNDEVAFPSLETLVVSNMESLKTIWNNQIASNSFPKLTKLEISFCNKLEEIFSIEEKINFPSATIPLSNDEVAFPSLETLVVSNMESLKTIWNNQIASNSFPKLTKLEISFCNKLMNVVSSYVLKHLETMIVTSCGALEVVFDMERLNSCYVSQHGLRTQLRTLTLEHLPKLKHIWSKDPCGVLGFQNLCTVEVFDCEGLNHVFPLSVGMELMNLQVLKISSCNIEHIVANDEMVELATKCVLPKLKSLTFWILPELRKFCQGIQTLECPNLKKLDVFYSNKLEIFAKESLVCQDTSDHDQPLFSFGKVIESVEDLCLNNEDVMFICNDQQSDVGFYQVKTLRLQELISYAPFPANILQRFPNLEDLTLFASNFHSIPYIDREGINNKLKSLTLNLLWHLENICQENSQMVLQNLQTLKVFSCSSLLTIAPSHIRFQNLNTLWFDRCDALVNILSSRTVRGMPALQKLVIRHCKMIKEIVVSEDDDDDASEIAFMKLEHLELECLPSLTSFFNGNLMFKFPLLDTLFLIECPMMETFSQGIIRAPLLRVVVLTPEKDGFHWNGDLNTTIEHLFTKQHYKEV